MPSDEEFRKVAEDMRALARSLARDVWDAAHSGRGYGDSPSAAFKRGIRDAVHGAKDEFRHGMRYGWGPPPPRYRPPGSAGGPGTGSADQGGAAGPQPAPGPGATGGWSPRSGPAGYGYWWGGRNPRGAPPWANAGWWSPGYPYRRPRPPRRRESPPPIRRKWDASLLTAVLVVVFGVAWLLSGLGAVHLATEAVLATGLMLLGAFLIVTARTDWSLSRHAWPVLLGLVLVIGLFATSSSFGVSGALSHVSFGDMQTQARSNGGTVYGGFGQLTVDASRLRPGSVLHVQSIAGQTRIELAPNETAVVQGKVLAGQVCVNGRSYASGVGASSPAISVPAQSGGQSASGSQLVENSGKPVTIDVHQLAGQVVVGAGCHGR